jgi:hypothetical protein
LTRHKREQSRSRQEKILGPGSGNTSDATRTLAPQIVEGVGASSSEGEDVDVGVGEGKTEIEIWC